MQQDIPIAGIDTTDKNTKGFQAATDDAVEFCADLNIPFFVDVRNKSWSSGLYVLMTKGILK